MKKCIAFISLLIVTVSLHAQTVSTTVQFEERVHDFGTIQEKHGKVSHSFIFHNTGKTPVAVNDVFSACGCIGNVITKDPVQPGGKGKVVISFDPAYKSGFFSKELVVYSNDRKEYSRIWVQGNIIPAEHPIQEEYPYEYGSGLYLRFEVMAFGYLKPGETKQMELLYANATNKPMTVRFAVKDNKKGLGFTDPGTISAKAKGTMNVSFTMPAPGNEDQIFTIYPYVNNKKLAKPLVVKILSWSTLKAKQKN